MVTSIAQFFIDDDEVHSRIRRLVKLADRKQEEMAEAEGQNKKFFSNLYNRDRTLYLHHLWEAASIVQGYGDLVKVASTPQGRVNFLFDYMRGVPGVDIETHITRPSGY